MFLPIIQVTCSIFPTIFIHRILFQSDMHLLDWQYNIFIHTILFQSDMHLLDWQYNIFIHTILFQSDMHLSDWQYNIFIHTILYTVSVRHAFVGLAVQCICQMPKAMTKNVTILTHTMSSRYISFQLG